jgi:diguanylate cyclase (GGDEF)-like protein
VKPGFAEDVLNALSAHIAVLDGSGSIVLVNDAWRRFARQNGAEDPDSFIGASYLAACEHALRSGGDRTAEAVLHGIRDLLSGERRSFSVEYPCHHPSDEPRWFTVHVTRFEQEGATYLVAAHDDITARKQAEEKLRESEATVRNVLEALPVGVWVMSAQGQIVHGNPAGRGIWRGARYVGPDRFGEYKGWWLSTGRRIAAEEWAAARAIRNGETSIDEEIRIECFDGSGKIILNSATPLRDAAGSITGAIIVNQDITSRKRVEEELRRANEAVDSMNRELQQVLARERSRARTDDLTGLNNRRHFLELSEQLVNVAQRYRTPLSVFMFDVDHFKRINDTYGHQAGDRILGAVARILRENMRDADVLARYGGEEFIATLPNTTAHEALAAAEHIRATIAAHREFDDGNRELHATISGGIADLLPDDDTLERLIQRADHALYEAKNAGRNCTRTFSPALLA